MQSKRRMEGVDAEDNPLAKAMAAAVREVVNENSQEEAIDASSATVTPPLNVSDQANDVTNENVQSKDHSTSRSTSQTSSSTSTSLEKRKVSISLANWKDCIDSESESESDSDSNPTGGSDEEEVREVFSSGSKTSKLARHTGTKRSGTKDATASQSRPTHNAIALVKQRVLKKQQQAAAALAKNDCGASRRNVGTGGDNAKRALTQKDDFFGITFARNGDDDDDDDYYDIEEEDVGVRESEEMNREGVTQGVGTVSATEDTDEFDFGSEIDAGAKAGTAASLETPGTTRAMTTTLVHSGVEAKKKREKEREERLLEEMRLETLALIEAHEAAEAKNKARHDARIAAAKERAAAAVDVATNGKGEGGDRDNGGSAVVPGLAAMSLDELMEIEGRRSMVDTDNGDLHGKKGIAPNVRQSGAIAAAAVLHKYSGKAQEEAERERKRFEEEARRKALEAEMNKSKGPLGALIEEGDDDDDGEEEEVGEEEGVGQGEKGDNEEEGGGSAGEEAVTEGGAEAKWANIDETVIAATGKEKDEEGKASNKGSEGKPSTFRGGKKMSSITFGDALAVFREISASVDHLNIETKTKAGEEEKGGSNGKESTNSSNRSNGGGWCCLGALIKRGPNYGIHALTKLKYDEWQRDLNTLYHAKETALNHADPIHRRMMATIYSMLNCNTKEKGKETDGKETDKIDCAVIGSHWESIGFQGNDPATDLRSTGMLSMLHLLFLVTFAYFSRPSSSSSSSSSPPETFMRIMMKVSSHKMYGFPVALASINLSRAVFAAVIDGTLSDVGNRTQDVIMVCQKQPCPCPSYRPFLYSLSLSSPCTMLAKSNISRPDAHHYSSNQPS